MFKAPFFLRVSARARGSGREKGQGSKKTPGNEPKIQKPQRYLRPTLKKF